jgi:DNA-binding NarL/FixJ family response regulator
MTAKKDSLTPRERQFALNYCIGYSSKESGQVLGVTEETVKTSIRQIKAFWSGGGMSRREFYVRAQEEGIIP